MSKRSKNTGHRPQRDPGKKVGRLRKQNAALQEQLTELQNKVNELARNQAMSSYKDFAEICFCGGELSTLITPIGVFTVCKDCKYKKNKKEVDSKDIP